VPQREARAGASRATLDVAAIVLIAGGQDQVGAFSAKAFRGGEADASRRARDHQDLAVEPPHIHRPTLTTVRDGTATALRGGSPVLPVGRAYGRQ
jgi:hypothetical protein